MLELLNQAVRFDVVRPTTQFDFRFAHALFREHLYGGLSLNERREHHWRLGQSLATAPYAQTDRGLSQVAHHLAQGALTQQQSAYAVAFGRRSADACVQRFALSSAVAEYQRTLKLAEAGNVECSERLSLMVRIADCLRFVGRRAEAREAAIAAADLARTQGLTAEFAESAIAYSRAKIAFVVDAEEIRILEEALVVTPVSEKSLRARVLAQLTVAAAHDPTARRFDASAEALRLGTKADGKTQAFVLMSRWMAHWGALSEKKCWPQWVEQGARAARDANEPELELLASWFLAISALEQGKPELSERLRMDVLARATKIGDPTIPYFSKVAEACLAIHRGSDDAAILSESARDLGITTVPELAQHAWFGQQFMHAIEAEVNLSEWLPQTIAWADAPGARPLFHGARALTQLMLERDEQIGATYQRFCEVWVSSVQDTAALSELCILAELCVYVGDHERAGAIYEELYPFDGYLGITGAGLTILGVASYSLGRLAVLLDRRETARQHFLDVAQLATRMGASSWARRAEAALNRLDMGGDFVGWRPRALLAS